MARHDPDDGADDRARADRRGVGAVRRPRWRCGWCCRWRSGSTGSRRARSGLVEPALEAAVLVYSIRLFQRQRERQRAGAGASARSPVRSARPLIRSRIVAALSCAQRHSRSTPSSRPSSSPSAGSTTIESSRRGGRAAAGRRSRRRRPLSPRALRRRGGHQRDPVGSPARRRSTSGSSSAAPRPEARTEVARPPPARRAPPRARQLGGQSRDASAPSMSQPSSRGQRERQPSCEAQCALPRG